MITEEEVIHFLQTAKDLIRIGKWSLIPRRKNLIGISDLGLTIPQVKQELLKLKYTNYDRGPLKDNDEPGEVWEFIKDVDTQEVYIKLKIDQRGCVCISFHPSKGPKTLPFRTNKKGDHHEEIL